MSNSPARNCLINSIRSRLSISECIYLTCSPSFTR
jgi:hypothetical protein